MPHTSPALASSLSNLRGDASASSAPAVPSSPFSQVVALLAVALDPLEADALQALVVGSLPDRPGTLSSSSSSCGLDLDACDALESHDAGGWRVYQLSRGFDRASLTEPQLAWARHRFAEAAEALSSHEALSPLARYLAVHGPTHLAEVRGVAAASAWLGSFARLLSIAFVQDGVALCATLGLLDDGSPSNAPLAAILRRALPRLAMCSSGAARQLLLAHLAHASGNPALAAEALAWLRRQGSDAATLLPLGPHGAVPVRVADVPRSGLFRGRTRLRRLADDVLLVLGSEQGAWVYDPMHEWLRTEVMVGEPISAASMDEHASGVVWLGDVMGHVYRSETTGFAHVVRVASLGAPVVELLAVEGDLCVARLATGAIVVLRHDAEPEVVVGPSAQPFPEQGGMSHAACGVVAAWTGKRLALVHLVDNQAVVHELPFFVGWVQYRAGGALLVGAAPQSVCRDHVMVIEGSSRSSLEVAEGWAVSLGVGDDEVAVFRWTTDDSDDVELAVLHATTGATLRARRIPCELPTRARSVQVPSRCGSAVRLIVAGGFVFDVRTLALLGAAGDHAEVEVLSDGTAARLSPDGVLEQVELEGLLGDRRMHEPLPGGFLELWSSGRARFVTLDGLVVTVDLPWVPTSVGLLDDLGRVLLAREDSVAGHTRLGVLDLLQGRAWESDILLGSVADIEIAHHGARVTGSRHVWDGDVRIALSKGVWWITTDGAVMRTDEVRKRRFLPPRTLPFHVHLLVERAGWPGSPSHIAPIGSPLALWLDLPRAEPDEDESDADEDDGEQADEADLAHVLAMFDDEPDDPDEDEVDEVDPGTPPHGCIAPTYRPRAPKPAGGDVGRRSESAPSPFAVAVAVWSGVVSLPSSAWQLRSHGGVATLDGPDGTPPAVWPAAGGLLAVFENGRVLIDQGPLAGVVAAQLYMGGREASLLGWSPPANLAEAAVA